MLLDATTRKLQIVLTAAKTTTDMPVCVYFVDTSETSFPSPGMSPTNSNGTTVVDILDAPAALTQRKINTLTVNNIDTAAKTVQVYLDDNGTDYLLCAATLQVGDILGYTYTDGWYTIDASGARKFANANYAIVAGTLAQFAATTSEQLAGVLSDETGTGFVVFNNSPTLTTPQINGIVTTTGLTLPAYTLSGAVTGNGQNITGLGDIGATNGTFTGNMLIGSLGTESSGININGTTYDSTFKVSDIDGTNYAQTILHRHSTTLEPLIVGARSNSDTSSHAAVTNGQGVFSIYAAGSAGSNYKIFGQEQFAADDTGTISNTSAPGKWTLFLTPDGSVTPAAVITARNDKSIAFSGRVYLPAGTVSAPSAEWDSGDGIYKIGAHNLGLSIAGVKLLDMASGAVGVSGVLTVGSGGNYSIAANGTAPRYFGLLAETNTYAGRLIFQAGGGSAGYGAALNLYGHSHATHPGDAVIGISSSSGGKFRVNGEALDAGNDWITVSSGGTAVIGTLSADQLNLPKTITAAGTTGAQTINKPTGSVNFAAAAASLVVTNSLVDNNSIINCTIKTNDATMKSVAVVATSGSFTIYPSAVPTAETRVDFRITN